jgi:hypothetical protein
MLAAQAGDKDSLEFVKKGFIGRLVIKEEYESALCTYQNSVD